jgi:hypothetical protein
MLEVGVGIADWRGLAMGCAPALLKIFHRGNFIPNDSRYIFLEK